MKKISFILLFFYSLGISVSSGQYTKLYDFYNENDLVNSGYSQPVFDGTWLYDGSISGGINGLGCLFKVKPDGTGYTKLLDFNGTNGSYPYGSLTLSGTVLYGMTNKGGANSSGTIFKINTDGTGYTRLLDFNNTLNGRFPNGSLTLSGSVLFGMTTNGGANGIGTIFSINTDGTGYTKLLDFAGTTNGSQPYGSLTLSGSVLYGMTVYGGANNLGTIFSINTDGTGYTKLLDFAGTTNGSQPNGSLTLSGSVLYGMTAYGGANSFGTVFKINTDGTGYIKLLDFAGTSNGRLPKGSLTLSGSVLYGMTSYGGTIAGTIFKINTDGTGYSKFLDFNGANGNQPTGTLTLSGSVMYGTTYYGGTNDKGVLFSINTDGTAFTKILDYYKAANGSNPYGSLVLSGSVLFGMTYSGGANGYGTIFKINSDGTSFTRLLNFEGTTNGSKPYGSLTLSGSVLYGMTYYGGANPNSFGTIFKINTDGTGYIKLLDFNGTTNGSNPMGSLTLSGSVLYGMTNSGGANGFGTIFKINTDGTGYTKLLDFAGTTNGNSPLGSLIISGTVLYGMTTQGGANSGGTIFKINTDGTGYTNMLDFAGTTNGWGPYGSLTISGTVLYGMTTGGGANSIGTIFKINTDGTGFSKLLDFAATTNGSNPKGSLTLSGSELYGMTWRGGANNFGTIFKINTDGTGFAKLLDFNGSNGKSPEYTDLILNSSTLYGMTIYGGTSQLGAIFRYELLPTGTKDLPEIAIQVFPNPSNEIINISGLSLFTKSKTASLIISDIIGKTVLQKNIERNTSSRAIDISSLENGVYLLILQTDKGKIVKRFIKQ